MAEQEKDRQGRDEDSAAETSASASSPEREPAPDDEEGAGAAPAEPSDERSDGGESGDGTGDGAAAEASRAAPPPPAPSGAAWAEPVARFERRWTWLETRLITFVLISQILALVAWVFLTGLSAPPSSGNAAGVVFRAIFGAASLGTLVWIVGKRQPLAKRRAATLVAFVLGAALAPLWRSAGAQYFDNLKAWLQEGSTLTLMGGLRGLGTRLTLWLALLGASLATSAGKHIHVDLLFRAIPARLRLPAAVLNHVAAAVVCFAAVWGFLDHIAIESFGARADQRPAEKIERVVDHVGHHMFLVQRQIGLDLRSLPRVLAGKRYEWMAPAEWNGWLKDAGYEAHYPGADLSNFTVPEGSTPHVPLVISPDGETPRGLLVHSLSLVFPFGLLMIGLRFLLRALLTVSGHFPVDPNEAHREDLHGAGPSSGEAAKAAGEA
ncbi:MAG TPA: TRAP transporter small permease subunit [Candidatus Nanopelagicales bacterium]|nr:TRAP transporter small permease subunit [Candidatus Nanopelagicales bacterium]